MRLSPEDVTPIKNLGLPAYMALHHSMKAISEAGLYALILRSNKPEAKAFQKWVTSVVLPAIRKDGAYVIGEEKVATGERGYPRHYLGEKV